MKTDILLGIPIYNEQEYIKQILNAAKEHIRHILVVNDGSTDATESLLKQHKEIAVLSHTSNQGYGQSLMDIFEYAKSNSYEWVITMDCDFQHQPACIPKFIKEIEKGNPDIISGTRYLERNNQQLHGVPKERVEINRRITLLLNDILGLNLTDAFCGFKAYRVDCLNTLTLEEKGYGMPLQLWIQAAKSKLRIRELAVPLIYHDPSRNFSGELENPEIRLRYYLDIIKQNLASNGYKNTEQIGCS